MPLTEFNHFFQVDDDATSGTSEFDESYDNDPNDCYCESFWEVDDECDGTFTTKLSVSVALDMEKCYNLWKTVPEEVWSSNVLGVDITNNTDDNWYLAITTPELFKDLLNETIRCCNSITFIVIDFDKLPDDRKQIHEGTPFDHDELLKFVDEIRVLASQIMSSALYTEPYTADKQMNEEELKTVNDTHEVGILFCSFVYDWISKYSKYFLRHMQESVNIFESGSFNKYAGEADLSKARGPIMNIRMRPATEDDTENMYNWEIDSIHPDLRTRSDVQELIRKDVDQSIKDTQMIMDGDKTIGMFTACMIDDGEWRYIGEIYLIPEYRGKGIGTSILKNEINNYDRIRLKVATTNDQAIKLYRSLGFEIIKEVDGQMYIMEYDKTKGTSTSMRLRKTDIELTKGWRVTYKGIGIYEALKNAMFTQTGSSAAWMAFINSDACNWLPKPPSYGNDNKSFFTEEGFNRFNELVLPIIAQYIDQTKIYIEEIMVPTNQIVYSDEFQFVTSDTIQESYTNTKSVSILYKRWSTKNGEQYKPIAKFWDIVEKHVKASKLQGYGTDWTGYGTDFLYGIIFKNGNIPKEVIDDVKKAFPDMIVDNSFSIPSSFEETYSGDTENIDSLYDKIWSKGFLSHELEEFTDDGKCTIRVSYKNKVSQESTIPRTNAVYLKGGEITKIENFKFNKVYFGSPNKIPSTMKLDGPLFVSPYPGIASIFAVRPQNLQKYGVKPGERINRDYDEWNHSLTDSVLQKPLTELHVKIVGAPYIKPTTELVSGYLYEIEVTPDIKQHIYQSQKMDKTFEYCIDKLDTIDFSNIKKVNIRMTVEGIANKMVQEAKLPSKKRKALDDSEFALVYTDGKGKKIRKYPIYDKAHCKAAARMFPRGVPLKYQSKVARKILRRAHEFGIDTSGWKNLNKFKESD